MAVSRNRGRGDAADHQWLRPVGDSAEFSGRATRHSLHWHMLVAFRARRFGSTAPVTFIDTLSGHDRRSASARDRQDTGRRGDGSPDADDCCGARAGHRRSEPDANGPTDARASGRCSDHHDAA
jgi:hypothetical protein